MMETKEQKPWYHGAKWFIETSPNPGYTSLSGDMPSGKPHFAFAAGIVCALIVCAVFSITQQG